MAPKKRVGLNEKTGLVLVGGGARAAYQAGMLAGINEFLPRSSKHPLFNVISGVSAGAINGAYLAARADEMSDALAAMPEVWKKLDFGDVFKSNPVSLSRIGMSWTRHLLLGGMLPQGTQGSDHLLNTDPLHRLLNQEISFSKIHQNILDGHLHGFAVSATNYHTGTEISFFDAPQATKAWSRSSRLGIRTHLRLAHVLASAAIPVLFKPVLIDGFNYGDGSIRQGAPLSPAVHMGADRILAISVRYRRPVDFTKRLNRHPPSEHIAMAEIFGVILNAAFFDGLEFDAERMRRVNITSEFLASKKNGEAPFPLRKIPLLLLRPSQDLGLMALEHFNSFPWTLRYLLKGLGASEEKGADFLSYLNFQGAYTERVAELGRKDALAQKEKIIAFFEGREFEDDGKADA